MTPLSSAPDQDALRGWLALARADQVGSVRGARLVRHFGSAAAVFRADKAEWRAIGMGPRVIDALTTPDWAGVEADLRWLQAGGADRSCLTLDHPDYPALLREIPDPPLLLFVCGAPAALSQFHVAMVGSRRPTPSGLKAAAEFAQALAERGAGVVSGLAVGIDAACHRGSLAGRGVTLAVMGTGPDRVYPPYHQALADEIIATGGALITEYPPGTSPVAGHFPRRNRIISGLARGTLVVEAALRSGSLITARLALEQNRDVFAVPGSIYSPASQGCNHLIQQGAKLVQTPDDILEEYPDAFPEQPPADPLAQWDAPRPEQEGLLKYIAYDPVTVDTLVVATGLPAHHIATALLELELQGKLASQPGGAYLRVG